MLNQIWVILWAQFRTIRNHLPRTGAGTAIAWCLSLLWYGVYGLAAWSEIVNLRNVPLSALRLGLPIGLLALLLFWQIFPLMTLSTGWSLDLAKLIVYPIRRRTLLAVELILRLTNSPESLILLGGAIIGLARHPQLPAAAALWLLLFLPLNLMLSLAIREALLKVFRRSKLKQILVVLLLSMSVLPSLLVTTRLGAILRPVFIHLATAQGTPWQELAMLSLNHFSITSVAVTVFWMAIAGAAAARQFLSLPDSDRVSADQWGSSSRKARSNKWSEAFFTLPNRLFREPMAALVEKELRVLARSPRFRVVFAIASIFSLIVFLPFSSGAAFSAFSRQYLPAVNAYSLLILGEVLLWNTFGFDRKAAQLYFVAPIPFSIVLRAKNTVAVLAIAAVTVVIYLAAAVVHLAEAALDALNSIALTSILTLFLLAFGNLSSVMLPRPIDPGQPFRNQNSSKSVLWLLLSLLILIVPVGFAVVAAWAYDGRWPYYGVLVADLVIAAITYSVATESAIERAERDREHMLDELSRGAAPIAS